MCCINGIFSVMIIDVMMCAPVQIVYGDFEVVKRNEEEVPSCYTLTQLSIKNMQVSSMRIVQWTHCHWETSHFLRRSK